MRDWANADLALAIDSGAHGSELVELGENADVCLAGVMRHIGCKTNPEVICTDWDSDYAIKVEEVLKAERLPEPIDLRRLPS